jgi:hypothetical protein
LASHQPPATNLQTPKRKKQPIRKILASGGVHEGNSWARSSTNPTAGVNAGEQKFFDLARFRV